jgi:ATP-dependent Clp protease ATP-binding subunit ClpC
MSVYRFATLVWQDTAGLFVAAPIETDADEVFGFGASAGAALEQLRDQLEWLYRRGQGPLEPDFHGAELSCVKVPVRPEYLIDERIYAGEESLAMPVHVVAGKTASGLHVAALPLLGVRFYYHEADALRGLVTRYAQQYLKGLDPRQLAAFLPPPIVQLEDVVVRVKEAKRAVELEAEFPALSQVAEPLGDRAVRKQFGHAWEREALVQQAVQKLHKERTHLLLVGEAGVGKSTVLIEAVKAVEREHAAEAARREARGPKPRLFWLTTAGRLIAGMKYLGQWEERCETVIGELAGIPGILCVDRLLDLVRLGGTGPNDSIAAFLMPYLQRGELRLAAEATPAELDACRRLLPGLVDLFPVLAVPPFERREALAVLDRTLERQTQNLRIKIGEEVGARTYSLFRRFMPYRVFPGVAAGFVRDVCERHARETPQLPLSAEQIVNQFVRRTGLPEWILRDEMPLDAEGLRGSLRGRVLGQDAAVQAAAQVIVSFKAGINDPGRPLGVLLFCGPTGVGKTELARALADVLFGHGEKMVRGKATAPRDRLVRLDMTEYAGFDAVERLLGPPGGEPGPLIRRLRQQPFCVLLLDEIEKASPEVFDLLLGVCDEGRLTDRFGRTTFFRSCVIVMTSNLGAGAREALGFAPSASPTYADFARDFFRPEFFNRLDAVVSFDPLRAETVRDITRKELAEIAAREGFRRANLRLRWTDQLVEQLAREGFDARFGARPLQRVLERQVVTPLARFLLAHSDLRDAEIVVDRDADGGLDLILGKS